MAQKNVGNPLDRDGRNAINDNFTELYDGVKQANNRVDGIVDEVSDVALGKVVDNVKLNWKEPVDNFSDLPSNAQKGDTRMDRSTGKVYRYDGTKWVEIQQIDASPVNEVDARLTSQFNESAKFEGQADFVEMIRSKTKYKEMRFKKIENPYEAISIFLHNGKEHITYEFRKNTNDDFYIFLTAFLGKLGVLPLYRESATKRTGTWSGLDGSSNTYTTEVGATFEASVKGERIELNHFADNRGGIFEIIINGDEGNPKYISTYSDTSVSKSTLIAEGLDPEKTHHIKGIFKGADPNNPPNGGIARGWIKAGIDVPNPKSYTVIGGIVYNGVYNSPENIMMLGFASNKEFAFQFENNGEMYWFPEHNNTGTAFAKEPLKIIIDSKEVNLDSLDNEETIICESVQILQNVRCELPNVSGKVADLIINYTITKDGIVSISGKLKIAKSTKIKNGYTMMFPLIGDGLSELVSSIGNSKKSEGDGSIYFMEEDSERVLSFAGIGEDKQNLITAFSFDYPYKTLRIGEDGKGTGDRFYYYHQRSNYPKLYARIFNELEVSNGFEYTFSGRYAIGNIEGIYDFVR